MPPTAHFPLGDIGRCNGLALDVKNKILFAACAQSRFAGQPPQRMMVILRATDGKILTTLPLGGGSDGAVFNPQTMEAFSSHSNGTLTVIKETSPTSFEVVQNLQTMDGARTLTLDTQTGHLFVMSVERGAWSVERGAWRAGRCHRRRRVAEAGGRPRYWACSPCC